MSEAILIPTKLKGVLNAPPSKSEAHRAMICAALGEGETVLTGFMSSDDTEATRNCLTMLGAEFEQKGDTLIVHGTDKPVFGTPLMNCRESGSTLRFFVPISMARAEGGIFHMEGRLGQRPMNVYRDLFVPQGTQWRMATGAEGAMELHVKGKLTAGDYVLPGNVSSQFASGMLFSLPLLREDSTLQVTEPVESDGYIRMTLSALRDSGIVIEETAPYTWRIPGGQKYRLDSHPILGDYTQAAVFFCAAALGSDIAVTGLERTTAQGDRDVLAALEKLGASVDENDERTIVTAKELHGAELDMRNCPDIAPMLALVCQMADGESKLTGCGRLRLKECDRLSATVKMLNQLGGSAREKGDTIIIRGKPSLKGGCRVDTQRDHRMVMLAAIAATVTEEPVTVPYVEAVTKSWPGFLKVYAGLGGKIE